MYAQSIQQGPSQQETVFLGISQKIYDLAIAGLNLDTRADFKANISLVTPSSHDMVSIHVYPGEVLAERFEPGYRASYSELVSLAMEASVQEGNALFVGEFGANDMTHGGAEEAVRIIQEILDALVENGVPLAAIWVYDRVVTDDESTQGWNITASNSRNHILKAIREANEALVQISNVGVIVRDY